MVGSADSIASPNTTLNAIVAEAFCEAADRLEKADNLELAIHDLIKEYMTAHQRIIFNGNGYAEEWVAEAKRRGLPNIKSMIEAAGTLTTDKAVKLFEKFHIFTKVELESREEIIYETYAKTINIEALAMIDMAGKQIIPAVIKYSKFLADTVNCRRDGPRRSEGGRCGCGGPIGAVKRSQQKSCSHAVGVSKIGEGRERSFRHGRYKGTGILL